MTSVSSDVVVYPNNWLTGKQMSDPLVECYPDGVPDTFPVELFAPVPADADHRKRDLALQDKISAMESLMLADGGLERAQDMLVDHKFADGVYVRTLFMPKGTVVSGRVHLRECVNIMVSGSVTLLTVDGPMRLDAPQMFVSPEGSKKVAYINEDTVWVTTHSLPPTDPEDIWDILTVPTFKDYAMLTSKQEALEDKQCLSDS